MFLVAYHSKTPAGRLLERWDRTVFVFVVCFRFVFVEEKKNSNTVMELYQVVEYIMDIASWKKTWRDFLCLILIQSVFAKKDTVNDFVR